ncbi:MAG: NitT/TauT family transport system substrate-binding protein [Thermoleophilaceae bacterium]|jgi:NitT/TauT family transport system substrate-binding protein|nr:NitT/TauT family transport system substrate-binding protein [Thermoleophilaceae bacterium]
MRRPLVLLLAAAAVLGACGDDGGGGGGGGGPAKLRVSDTAGVPSAFLEYGVHKGYFRKRDLDVKVQPSQGGATVVPAVVSGDVDIGGSNLVSVLLARDKDIPVKIVAPGTFVAKDDFSAIVVAKDSDIRQPKDLEGKTLAVNTLKNVAEVTARASLDKQGVDTSKIKLTEVDFPDMTAAVEQGRVDAAFAIEPFVSQAAAAGNRIVDRPYVGTKPGLQIGCYFASEQYLAENEDVVKRFRAGVAETAKAIAVDPGAFRKFLPEASEIPPPAAQKAVLPAWKESSDPASVDLIADLMQRYGITPEKPDTSEALAE